MIGRRGQAARGASVGPVLAHAREDVVQRRAQRRGGTDVSPNLKVARPEACPAQCVAAAQIGDALLRSCVVTRLCRFDRCLLAREARLEAGGKRGYDRALRGCGGESDGRRERSAVDRDDRWRLTRSLWNRRGHIARCDATFRVAVLPVERARRSRRCWTHHTLGAGCELRADDAHNHQMTDGPVREGRYIMVPFCRSSAIPTWVAFCRSAISCTLGSVERELPAPVAEAGQEPE